VENQSRELRQIAERRGWQVVTKFRDAGISGAKGRDSRPGLDQMLKDASKRRFDAGVDDATIASISMVRVLVAVSPQLSEAT
jgi:DNA invertase Pin-like site-specific DNA recombinase